MANKAQPLRINSTITSLLILFHGLALYGFFLLLTGHCSWQLFLYQVALTYFSGFTFGTGDYGMWSNKAFIPSKGRRVALMLAHTLTLQGPLTFWVRIHRLHHSSMDTSEDASSALRGVVYSHIGWLVTYNEKQVKEDLVAAKVQLEDIKKDEVVMWQSRNYYWASIVGLVVMCLIPLLMGWETSILNVLIATVTGCVVNLHMACWTNMWGTKSYERSIGPVMHEIVHFLTYGMGRVC